MSRLLKQFVIFGAQGSGKGTQAARLAEQLGLELIGSGDVLRKMAKEDTPSGQKIAPIIQSGQLVPDDMMNEIIALQLAGIPVQRGFVLEGYPRTIAQSELLEATLEQSGRDAAATIFINLDVPRDVLRKRLQTRGRHDDTEELIEERLRLYDERTAPILEAVDSWAQVLHVDGNQPVELVTETITKQLNHVQAKA